MSTVLFLTDSLAVWICLIQGKAANVHVETIHPDNGAYKPCSWLNKDKPGNKNLANRHTFVTLVLDSDASAVEAYPLKTVGSALSHRSNTKALRDELIKTNPEAIVSTPGKVTKLDTLLVQPLQLTERQQQWLAKVAKTTVVLRSVVTTPEILATLFAHSGGPYVVISHVLGSCKHVYCRAGCALFVRCFSHLDTKEIIPDLEETLVHLRSSELIDNPISAYTMGLSVEVSQAISQLHDIKDVNRFESLREYDQSVVSDANCDQYHSVIQIAKTANLNFAKPPSDVRSSATAQLNKYRDVVLRKRQRMGAALLLLISVVSIGSSAFVLRERYQLNADAGHRIVELQQAISELRVELLGLSSAGETWSTALVSALSIREGAAPGPGVLLAMLGQILSEHKNILLDELSWVSYEDDENSLTPVAVESALDQVNSRTAMPSHVNKPSLLLVRLSGRSVSSAGLRARQETVNVLVNELQQQAEVSFVHVVESPLQLSSEAQTLNTEKRESAFQLHFRLRGMFHNDA